MEPADAIAPGGAAWDTWPARSRAEVVFLPGEKSAAQRFAIRCFHRALKPREYAGLAGAPDDARVEIGAGGGELYVEMGKSGAYRGYYYVRRAAARLVLLNDGFHVIDERLRGRGFGLRVLHRQARNAARLGLRRIETVAGRRRGENGYYTWPRYGFDAPLPAHVRRLLPPELDGARTLLDLMESPDGRRWWRARGATVRAVFDLSAGSRSWKTLRCYVRSKRGSGVAKNKS